MPDVATKDLEKHALDWAVATAEGLEPYLVGPHYGNPWRVFIKIGKVRQAETFYNVHESWALGGPLRDKYRVEFLHAGDEVHAKLYGLTNASGCGSTALVAACRAIVLHKLGPVVRVPAELLESGGKSEGEVRRG